MTNTNGRPEPSGSLVALQKAALIGVLVALAGAVLVRFGAARATE